MGVLAFLVVARLVARSSSVINARSIATKVHPTMVEVNPTPGEVELTTLDVKLTVVEADSVVEEFDSVAKELYLVLVHLFLRRQSLFGRCGVDSTVGPRQLQFEVYLDRITNSIP
jgi:hypothetical protein